MDKNLIKQALAKVSLGVVLVGLLLFLPAGSLRYWQGWVLMGILFVPMFIAGFVMLFKNPDLLRKRLNAKDSSVHICHPISSFYSDFSGRTNRKFTLPTDILSPSRSSTA